ncbi:hypothetical protein B1F74_00355 [Pseudomonas syringae]|nr:hypothetical protein B1F74_00355 [Pseudomonas syringae]
MRMLYWASRRLGVKLSCKDVAEYAGMKCQSYTRRENDNEMSLTFHSIAFWRFFIELDALFSNLVVRFFFGWLAYRLMIVAPQGAAM